MITKTTSLSQEYPAPLNCDNTSQTASSQAKNHFSIKNHKRRHTFRIYENIVEYNPPSRSKLQKFKHSPVRGLIKRFSKRSRFRLFALLAKVKKIEDKNAIFITLTYHYNYGQCDGKAQLDLHKFLTSIREYDSKVQYIWRLEYQQRGAPHFHFMLFPGDKYDIKNHYKYCKFLSNKWHSIADPNSRAHSVYGFKEIMITDYRKACAYLSKYIAKMPDSVGSSASGKHWGNSRNMPTEVYSSISCMREHAALIIEELRKWLIKNGKDKYASKEYFNEDRPQGVFISLFDFEMIIRRLAGVSCVFEENTIGFY